MKSLIPLLAFILIPLCFHAQNPTDCIDAVIVCGNSNVNLNVNGFGTQEIAGLGCSSQENNSLWLRVKAQSNGTLGFNLIPTNTSITEDYDFWVFGPDVTCGNLGLPIRCSTTNPQAAGQTNNHTGLDGSSTDLSEGPGPDGNSFVRWLDVLQDEVYYIVIDRPIGNSGFSLEWTGTADLGEQPESQTPVAQLNYESCDEEFPFDDQVVTINFNDYTPLILGTQTNVIVSYHSTESDAILNVNPLPNSYNNSSPNETIFIRITNTVTDCFEVTSFDITIFPKPVVNNVSYVQCDEDGTNDSITQFNLDNILDDITNQSVNSIEVFLSAQEATDDLNALTSNTFFNTTNPQMLFTRVTNINSGCVSFSEIMLEVSSTSIPDYQVPPVCDELNSEDGINTFSLNDISSVLLASLPSNITITYYLDLNAALNEENPISSPFTNTIPYSQTIFARANDPFGCYGISEIMFTINTRPQVEEDELTYYCLNSFPETITLDSGNLDSNWGNYTYLWSNGETTESIEVNQPGDYTVTISNASNCDQSRTITVEASNIATIEDIVVVDGSLSFNNTVTVNVSGEGIYEYALFNDLGAYVYYQDSPTFENVVPGFYTVQVRDVKNFCGIVDQLISVVGFPRFFTPNNDGYRDTWQVYGISEQFQSNSKILIYDRFGKLLKQLDPLGTGWDGTFNGQALPNNDYWFAVTLQDGRVYKSHFTLKR